MKKTLKIMAIAGAALTASSAFCETPSTPELMAIQYLTEAGQTVAFPIFKTADGSICHSYVAAVSNTLQTNGKIETDAAVTHFCEMQHSQ